MDIKLTQEEQSRLVELAQRTGRNVEDVVRAAIDSFLRQEISFVHAVEKGLASLDSGRHITHEAAGLRISRLFHE